MACAEFQDRLIDYEDASPRERTELDVHLARCADCRSYWNTLEQLDGALALRYSVPPAPHVLEDRIRTRIAAEARLPRVSFLPEVLDFIGGASLLAIACGLAWLLVPEQVIAILRAAGLN
jgi:hypothetical protein